MENRQTLGKRQQLVQKWNMTKWQIKYKNGFSNKKLRAFNIWIMTTLTVHYVTLQLCFLASLLQNVNNNMLVILEIDFLAPPCGIQWSWLR